LCFLEGKAGDVEEHDLSVSCGKDLITVRCRPNRCPDTLSRLLIDGDVRSVRKSAQIGAIACADQMMEGAVHRFGRVEVPVER
jgi:hypothetical protein